MLELEKEKQIKRYVTLGIIVFLIILITIILTNLNKHDNKNQIIQNLKDDGFEENIKNIYYKDLKETTGNQTTTKKYSYNITTNEKNVTITNQDNSMNETIIINVNNSISNISYLYNDNNGCNLKQTATLKDNKFKCNITSKNGDCKIKCDLLQSELKKFIKEMQNYEKSDD